MGDCGEDFKALKKHIKERKTSRYEDNILSIRSGGLQHEIDNNGSVLCHCGNGRAIFYPSTNKWQYKSSVYYGDAIAFMAFVNKVDSVG